MDIKDIIASRATAKSDNNTTQSNEPQIVEVRGDQVVTTSILVASKFGKPHKDVIRAIKSLRSANSKLNPLYQADTYKDKQGRNRPMYYFTRNGFVFLAMRFIGKDALDFKFDYIDAFNAMERELLIQTVEASVQMGFDSGTAKYLQLYKAERGRYEIGRQPNQW